MTVIDRFRLDGRIIIVTGGLGQLGRQFVLALREAGARVAVLDIAATHERCRERYGEAAIGRDLLFLQSDITSRQSLFDALDNIERTWGTPSGLINNAALDSPPDAPAEENGPFESYPEASWDKVMEVNVKGTLLPSQVFGGRMAEKGNGSIVNISSIYGLVSPDQRIYMYRYTDGKPFFKPVAYSASKSALLNLTRYLSTYWASKNVRVNSLTLAGVFNNQDHRFLEGYLPKVPLGRMANADEYNGAVVFLLSEASSYMTGSNMILDGGFTAW